MDSEDLVAEHQ